MYMIINELFFSNFDLQLIKALKLASIRNRLYFQIGLKTMDLYGYMDKFKIYVTGTQKIRA